MERVTVRNFMFGVWGLLSAVAACFSTNAWAGTKFTNAESEAVGTADRRGEVYAESRFGAPPARVNTGRESKFSAFEKEEFGNTADSGMGTPPDSLNEDLTAYPGQSGRVPAGLEFKKGTKGSASSDQYSPVKPVDYETKAAPRAVKMEEWSGQELAHVSNAVGRGVQEVAIIASDLGFFPKTLFVNRDVPVRLFVTGASKNTLCIMMDSFQVKKQVRSQKIEEVVFTPNVPGKYRFYCPVNGMEGSLVVRELGSPVGTGPVAQADNQD